ncbi:hypothetical protein O181_012689 [Austropuccinia psidii MF-1]|uniref:Uncharacterized protein n=1 Tax=Austropuccinia psidii MF-1 TaxID=1389203 RepID=A0A9Q3GN40_9BASI|nr:hypothetical protein [Austropuccinia psidii MF-1]
MSRIEDWRERAYIHVYNRGLASRILEKLASHPGSFDTLQELIDINLELYRKCHERKKEKGINQDKKPPITGSNSSGPSQDSSYKKRKKGKKSQFSKDKTHSALLNKYNKLIFSGKEGSIKQDLCTYCGGKHSIEKCFNRPQNWPGTSRGFPCKQEKA